jgi:lipid II:glycine glycyltransferase (peptidoglycan interpeptide bridge formation enzyme)
MFYQSENWALFQKKRGFETFFVDDILIIKKPLFFGKCFFEIQRALFDEKKWHKIIENAKEEKAVFIRIAWDDEVLPDFISKKAYKSTVHHFPELTLILDLSKTEQELLADMSQSGRRHLRKAQKSDIEIKEVSDVDGFYQILEETTSRNGFFGHKKEYYQNLLKYLGGQIFMINAIHEGDLLSSCIFVNDDDTCIYLYGASSNHKRELQAPTLLQYEAILKAKKQGKRYYDFFGIAPSDQLDHPWKNVTQFKKKFGGHEKSYAPEAEFAVNKFWYFVFVFLKGLRKIFKTLKHQFSMIF